MQMNPLIILSFAIMAVSLIVLIYGIIGDFAGFANSGLVLAGIGAIVLVVGKLKAQKG